MTVYVLSWENSDMETLVFSSFEKAYQVAKFIREQLSSFKVTWTEEEEGYSLVWHFEHQGDEESNEFSPPSINTCKRAITESPIPAIKSITGPKSTPPKSACENVGVIKLNDNTITIAMIIFCVIFLLFRVFI